MSRIADPRMYSEIWVCFMSVRLDFTNQSKGSPWFSSGFTESHRGRWQDGFGIMGSHHLCIPEAWPEQ